MLRIGEISYLNCTPVFAMLRERFADPDYCFVPGVPAVLNHQLSGGEIDVCPSSSIEYARHPGSYLILPGISIAAIGDVKSVLLLSPQPLEALDGAEIALTGESATSVALLKILLTCRYSFTNRFRVATAEEQLLTKVGGPLLLIGDSALRAAVTGGYRYVYDLGKLWFDYTGLPFVFALWLIRRSAVAREPAACRRLAERLIISRQLAVTYFAEIAAVSVQNDWTNREFLINYWQTISYDLDEKHLEGLKLYFKLAVQCGIIEHEPPLCLLD